MTLSLRKKELTSFLNSLGLNIKNLNLLNTALTHSSYVKEHAYKTGENNERLEFLGDAVLKLFISEYLMSKYKDYSEGELSKSRAYVVSEKVLADIAKKLNLKKYLLLGKNEKKSVPVSILADAVEALLAVIFYDCGEIAAKDFVLSYWKEYVDKTDEDIEKDNYKAVLQEYLQGKKRGLPLYKTVSEAGPDHNKEFEVAVCLNNNELARGKGKTKKEASQQAAKNALKTIY